MTKPANTTDLSRLPAIYRQWERIEDRRQAMTNELKSLFRDARDEGYNPKSMRVAFKEIYRVNHQTFDEAEKREKADAEAEVYMLALARVRESDPDHDPITGEIIDTNSADPTHVAADPAATVAENVRVAADHIPDAGKMVAADQSTGNVDGSAGRSHSDCHLSTESPASVPVDTNSHLQHDAGDRADPDPHSLVGSSNSNLQDDLGDQAGAAAAGLSNSGRQNAFAPGSVRYERTPTVGIVRHEAQRCFPEHWGMASASLKDDIRANGIREPILMQGNVLLDGWSRYMAARELGIDYPVREYDGTDPLADIIKLNMASRSLNLAERVSIGRKLIKVAPDREGDIVELLDVEQQREAAQ